MLVIIDMQPMYDASAFVVPAVCKQITRAKNRKETVVLVEYRCYGCRTNGVCYYLYEGNRTRCDTHSEIAMLLDGYSKLIQVQKERNDGSKEVTKAVPKFPSNVNVCGVNTRACVRETVEGLIKLRPKNRFTLLLDACNDSLDGQNNRALYWTTRYQNTPRKNSLTLSIK